MYIVDCLFLDVKKVFDELSAEMSTVSLEEMTRIKKLYGQWIPCKTHVSAKNVHSVSVIDKCTRNEAYTGESNPIWLIDQKDSLPLEMCDCCAVFFCFPLGDTIYVL